MARMKELALHACRQHIARPIRLGCVLIVAIRHNSCNHHLEEMIMH